MSNSDMTLYTVQTHPAGLIPTLFRAAAEGEAFGHYVLVASASLADIAPPSPYEKNIVLRGLIKNSPNSILFVSGGENSFNRTGSDPVYAFKGEGFVRDESLGENMYVSRVAVPFTNASLVDAPKPDLQKTMEDGVQFIVMSKALSHEEAKAKIDSMGDMPLEHMAAKLMAEGHALWLNSARNINSDVMLGVQINRAMKTFSPAP